MFTFALDIGTRKVAGILGELNGDKVKIIDAVIREHEKRAMLDGQIHNIEDVTKIVKEVVSTLEQKNGVKIEKVTTALAGRSLHTETTEFEFPKKGEVTQKDLTLAEIESVKKAYAAIAEKEQKDYYCVGYSPVYYALDGDIIKNPVQQNAKKSVGVRTIVTFLPKIVFDSMIAVLKNCSLAIDGLTLEPIAALFVTIPEDMRLLNLALVDVGAGTSDIAITDKGRITAYGMIPKAGDELTEEVCREFIVDFNAGEKIKRGVEKQGSIPAKDIFNKDVTVTYDEFKRAVNEKAEELAKDIADEILNLNAKQPQAVVMVGGGSSLELLRNKVAANLGLPSNRVGSRVPENVVNLINLPGILKGTEGITPVGILETAVFKKGIGFIEVLVNGEKEYIINLDQEIRVIDVLVSHGIEMKKLYGKPGEALTYTLNGELRILRGGKSEHSKIFVNGEEKTLYDSVKNGDKIFTTESKSGAAAGALIKDIIPESYYLTVQVNGKTASINPVITCNGKEVTADEPVTDRADIKIEKIDVIKELLAKAGYGINSTNERDIIVTLNGEPVALKQRNYQLKVNGMEVSIDFRVKNMDRIEYRDMPAYYRIKDVLKGSSKKVVKVIINGKPFELEAERNDIFMNGKAVSGDEFIINGAAIEVKTTREKMILSSIFKVYPIDMQRTKGKMLQLSVNGEKAGYTTPISEGSEIKIEFI